MSFRTDDKKLLQKYKAIWTKIENFQNVNLNALPIYDDRHTKNKIRTYGDKVFTKFSGLNVPENDIEYECFTVISIDSLHVYENNCFLQVYLENCAHKIVNKQITDYLDENVFED